MRKREGNYDRENFVIISKMFVKHSLKRIFQKPLNYHIFFLQRTSHSMLTYYRKCSRNAERKGNVKKHVNILASQDRVMLSIAHLHGIFDYTIPSSLVVKCTWERYRISGLTGEAQFSSCRVFQFTKESALLFQGTRTPDEKHSLRFLVKVRKAKVNAACSALRGGDWM